MNLKLPSLVIPLEKPNKISIIVIFILVILFEFLLKGSLIPPPSIILKSILKVLNTSTFYNDLLSSVILTLKGILYSSIIAAMLSYLYTIPLFKFIVLLISKFRYLTLSGLIIVFTIIFPNGADFKLALIIFGIVPFFVTSFISYIDDINTELYDLCAVLRMSKWRTLYEVIILGKLDLLLEIMRQNFAIAWLTITMAEGLNLSGGGLGTLILKSNRSFGIAYALAVLLIILIVGIGFDYIFNKLRLWFFPYTKFKKS